jgi:mitochondrial fission protein ELM1
MSEPKVPTILVSVDKAGHVNQCLGFCNLIGWRVDETFRVPGSSKMQPRWQKRRASLLATIYIAAKAPRRRQFQRLSMVASGTAAEDLAWRYRKIYGADLFAVFVGSPKSRQPIFDFAVASHHALGRETPSASLYPAAKKTLWMAGVLTRGVKSGISQGNLVVALIGGLNKAFAIEADQIAKQLVTVIGQGDTLAVVFSRRTPLSVEQRLRDLLALPNVQFIDRSDRAGFESAFAQAREFVVTPDSITMICEACATEKRVRILSSTCFDPETSTARFVREFLDKGYARNAADAESTVVLLPSLEPIKREVDRAYEAWLRQITPMS